LRVLPVTKTRISNKSDDRHGGRRADRSSALVRKSPSAAERKTHCAHHGV